MSDPLMELFDEDNEEQRPFIAPVLTHQRLDPLHGQIEMFRVKRAEPLVVVSHVPELRHRVEDLIELDRHPTTGDTRVLSS